MSQKFTIMIFAFIAAVLVFFILIKNPKKDVATHNATVRYVAAGHTGVACEDARRLTDIFARFADEKSELMERYEKSVDDNDAPIAEEILSAMQREAWTTVTPAQKELDQWHNEVITFINKRFRGRAEEIRIAEDAVGADMYELHFLVRSIKLGLLSEAETLQLIEERYCSDHTR